MQQVELAPGYRASRLIKGGWQTIGRGPDVVHDLLAFVEAGVTTFETADSYEGGEALMGTLRRMAGTKLPRETADKIRIHTRYTAPLSGGPPTTDDVTTSVERSLKRLGVERLDLLQIQWWNLEVPGLIETAQTLADLQQQGKIGLLGTANLGMATLERLLEAGVPLATSQVHYSLVDRRIENGFAAYCAAKGIGLMTFAPFAGGFLSERWRGEVDPRDSGESHSAEHRALIDAAGSWRQLLDLLTALSDVAAKHGVSLPVIALAWALRRMPNAAIIFGASSPERLPPILTALDLELSDDDLADLESVALERPLLDVGDIERAPDSVLMRAIKAHHT